MLGFPVVERITTNSAFGSVSSVMSMDDTACTGSEASLFDCVYNSNDNCGGSEGAGVACAKAARRVASK